MSIVKRLRTNFEDVLRYGPQFLRRHSPRITGAETALVRVGRHQTIHVRAGETDIAAVRGVFGVQQYNISNVIPNLDKRINDRYAAIIRTGALPIIVDAGANIGAASLWFKGKYPESVIVAIEPEPGNFGILAKNAALSNQIIPIEAAIGSEAGFVALQNGTLGWGTRVEPAPTGLPIVTMQQAFNTVTNGKPFIAKIDIEGFEQELFSKNTSWLSDVFVVHIEPHDWMLPGEGSSLPFQKAMAQYDFEIFIAGEILTYVKHSAG